MLNLTLQETSPIGPQNQENPRTNNKSTSSNKESAIAQQILEQTGSTESLSKMTTTSLERCPNPLQNVYNRSIFPPSRNTQTFLSRQTQSSSSNISTEISNAHSQQKKARGKEPYQTNPPFSPYWGDSF